MFLKVILLSLSQIVAIIAIALGFLFAIPFQILIKESPDSANLPRLPWFKWLQKPQFFLVS